MIHTVHASRFSLLPPPQGYGEARRSASREGGGSCSGSVLASQFNVRCSMKATSRNAERGTRQPEHRTELEHELSTEK